MLRLVNIGYRFRGQLIDKNQLWVSTHAWATSIRLNCRNGWWKSWRRL